MNVENLIESKPGKQLEAALAAMHDMKVPLPELLQPQRDSGHCPHEGRIHHRAMF